jgi:hypothetical protein
MTRAEIEYLITTIPEGIDVPYTASRAVTEFSEVQGEARDILQRRSWLVMQPDFVWNYTKAFAEQGRSVPELGKLSQNKNQWIQCLNNIQSGNYDAENQVHQNIMEAYTLRSAAKDVMCEAISGLLLKPDQNYASIGARFNLSEEVINLYDQLFWNVRDRLKDRDYIISLVYPGPERNLALLSPNYLYETKAKVLRLQTAFNHDVETLLIHSGLVPMSEVKMDAAYRLFEAGAMFSALTEMQLGGGHGNYPGMIQAGRLIQATKLSGQEQNNIEEAAGIGAVAKRHPVLEGLNKMLQPSVDRMLELDQGDSKKILNVGEKDKLLQIGKPKVGWEEYQPAR